MTLLEMIKKWEGVKDDLEKQNLPGTRIKGDIEVAEDIIKDLKSVSEYISEENVRTKILKKMLGELDSYEFGKLEVLAHVYSTLSD